MPILESIIPEKDPLFLGGSAGNGTHPPTTTVYGRLSRPRMLPPLDITSCNASSQVNTILQTLSTGKDLSIHWACGQDGLVLKVYYTGNEFYLSDSVMFAKFTPNPVCVTVEHMITWMPLKRALSNEHQETLACRLLHLFLRRQGSSLDYPTVDQLYSLLSRYYAPNTKKEKWKVLLDLAITRTDVALTLEQPNTELFFALKVVGEALQAQEQFEEAAIIYQTIVDSYAPTVQMKMPVLSYCASAWHDAKNYKASEEAYVKTLHLRSTFEGLELAEHDTCIILGNFVLMYYQWTINQRPNECDETRLVIYLFLALLYKAEFQPPSNTWSCNILMEAGPCCESLLAPKFRSKDAASQAVVFACSASKVPTFRSCILACKDPKSGCLPSIQLPGVPDRHDSGKKEARAIFRNDRFAPRSCGNPDCSKKEPETPLFSCPCKNIQYCGKSCQHAHFKEHRRTCAYVAERKKIKK